MNWSKKSCPGASACSGLPITLFFFIGVAGAIALKFSIYEDLRNEFFLVALGGWLGILAIQARYAMAPIFRRSEKESQLKAIIPDAWGEKMGTSDNRGRRRGGKGEASIEGIWYPFSRLFRGDGFGGAVEFVFSS